MFVGELQPHPLNPGYSRVYPEAWTQLLLLLGHRSSESVVVCALISNLRTSPELQGTFLATVLDLSRLTYFVAATLKQYKS